MHWKLLSKLSKILMMLACGKQSDIHKGSDLPLNEWTVSKSSKQSRLHMQIAFLFPENLSLDHNAHQFIKNSASIPLEPRFSFYSLNHNAQRSIQFFLTPRLHSPARHVLFLSACEDFSLGKAPRACRYMVICLRNNQCCLFQFFIFQIFLHLIILEQEKMSYSNG